MRAELRPAAFIDRDGVINRELGYVYRPQDFEVLAGALDGLTRLQHDGFALVVVTNQAGIARGLYTLADYARLTEHMTALLAARGIELTAVYHCPHHPEGRIAGFNIDCSCRKPAPGMLLRAASECGLDLTRSVLVGDKLSDIGAGRSAGVPCNVLVRSGHDLPTDATSRADHVCDDLGAAARWIGMNRLQPSVG